MQIKKMKGGEQIKKMLAKLFCKRMKVKKCSYVLFSEMNAVEFYNRKKWRMEKCEK